MTYGKRQSDLRNAQSEKDRAAVHVSLLVKVLAFDSDAMTVDVQPLNKEMIDGQYVSAAPLLGLRVACLCTGDYVIRPWYKRGDIGVVIVGDTDADLALQTGTEAEPNTERLHAPEDGIFIGGICPAGKTPTGLPKNALVLAAKNTYIAITSDGITINGSVTITGRLTASGINMTNHIHTGPSVLGGDTSGPR